MPIKIGFIAVSDLGLQLARDAGPAGVGPGPERAQKRWITETLACGNRPSRELPLTKPLL